MKEHLSIYFSLRMSHAHELFMSFKKNNALAIEKMVFSKCAGLVPSRITSLKVWVQHLQYLQFLHDYKISYILFLRRGMDI